MNLKVKLILFVLFSFLISCTSKEEKTIQEFINHAKNLNIDEIKKLSTENTNFYIKMAIEPIISLGNAASKQQLKKIVSTLECSGEDGKRKCSYIDDNGNKQFFELEFIAGYDELGKKKLFIDIDKKYFFGE